MTDYEKLLHVFAVFGPSMKNDETESGEKTITLSNRVTIQFSRDGKISAYRISAGTDLFCAVPVPGKGEGFMKVP